MPRITKDPTERRQEILDTALKLFWEKGYEKTSMTEIARPCRWHRDCVTAIFHPKRRCFRQLLINMPSGKWIRSPAY